MAGLMTSVGALPHGSKILRPAFGEARRVAPIVGSNRSVPVNIPSGPASANFAVPGGRSVVCRGFFSNLFSGFGSKPQPASNGMLNVAPPPNAQTTTLGGGCFWCLEACYQQLKGVYKVESGYAGGHVKNPTYEEVCGKKTGHAEVVQITYDPTVITFTDLLDIFFTIHDPTTPNRQGNDVGPQYRSIIMYHDEQQKEEAEAVMARVAAEKWFSNPLVTELVPLNNYYTAEKYHQNYYATNPSQGYCSFVVGPKVQKFRSKFFSKLAA